MARASKWKMERGQVDVPVHVEHFNGMLVVTVGKPGRYIDVEIDRDEVKNLMGLTEPCGWQHFDQTGKSVRDIMGQALGDIPEEEELLFDQKNLFGEHQPEKPHTAVKKQCKAVCPTAGAFGPDSCRCELPQDHWGLHRHPVFDGGPDGRARDGSRYFQWETGDGPRMIP